MFNVIQHEKDLVKSNISKMYENSSEKLEKGGPGSGRKIGTTKSGKDIYSSFDDPHHKDFTSKDHEDAADLHRDTSEVDLGGETSGANYEVINHHEQEASKHEHAASWKRDKEKSEGKTSTGAMIKKD